jgi:hypothetical protein
MLHPFTQIHMQQNREDIARGLAARPREEVEAIFAKCQASFDRVAAFESGDWVRYVELGGDIEIARRADPLSFPLDIADFD